MNKHEKRLKEYNDRADKLAKEQPDNYHMTLEYRQIVNERARFITIISEEKK